MKLVKLRDTNLVTVVHSSSSIRVTAPIVVAGKKGRIVVSVVPSKHLPLLKGRDFLTPARAVVDMARKTLRIGTGVDDLVVSRAGHLALRLDPQDWHREANLIEDNQCFSVQGGRDRTLGPRNCSKQFDAKSAKLSVSFLAER